MQGPDGNPASPSGIQHLQMVMPATFANTPHSSSGADATASLASPQWAAATSLRSKESKVDKLVALDYLAFE
jgi:hypothetical protein